MNDHDLTHQHSFNDDDGPAARLEYLRGELRAERISYAELAELQCLAPYIEPGDTELLEAAGVPEEEAKPDRSPWIICPECSGEGKSSAYLGSFTREDIERDWDPDDWQEYLDGAYDRPCNVCRGTGKLRQSAWDNYCEEHAERASESHHEFHPGYGRYGY